MRAHKDCLQEKYKTHPFCRELINIPNRFSQLSELIYGSDPLEVTESQAFCLKCIVAEDSEINRNDNLNILTNWLKTLDKNRQCIDLQPGQEKIIYPILKEPYNVKRESDGSHSIPLRLNFFAEDDYDGDTPPHQVHKHYMEKVQECIGQANQNMLGPKGEKLKIVIQDPDNQTESNCNNDTIEIGIASSTHRSSATTFQSNIDCSAITHEILHHLGLCDAYIEHSRGYYVDPKTGKEYFTANMSMEKIEQFAKDEKYYFTQANNCRTIILTSIMSGSQISWDNVFKKGINKSLLAPGQWNAILYGTCERNKFFNECSQLAYKSSFQAQNADCLQKKQQCEIQNFSGADKQQELQALREAITENDEKIQEWTKPGAFERYEQGSAKAQVRLPYELVLDVLNNEAQYLEGKKKIVESWPSDN